NLVKFPIVSIIIPTYNRSGFLGETLDSVFDQTYSNWECIVVDDGSLDATPQLMEFYCNKDSRFMYFKRSNKNSKGQSACCNIGFRKSKGTYVMWLDDDDILHKDKLLSQVKLVFDKSHTIVTCGWGRFSNS